VSGGISEVLKSLSEFLNIPSSKLYDEGCFNSILNLDSSMFINLTRLKETKIPELNGAYKHLLKLFRSIGKLLLVSRTENDIFWKKAFNLLEMSECEEICLGYSKSSTAGSGSGAGLKTKILRTGKQILDAGVNEPEIFELVGLFEDNIGSDRLSDFIAHIIKEYLERFTRRVLLNLEINQQTRRKLKFCDGLIENPFNNKKIYILPLDILHELPIAREWEQIDIVCQVNSRIREEINKRIGQEWHKMTTAQKKIEARKILHNDPGLLKTLVKDYRDFKLQAYDFLKDPLGEASWQNAVKEYSEKYPLHILNKNKSDITSIKNIVIAICNKFKELIENNGLNELLYSDGNPRKERIAQKLFYGIADIYCENNNLDINPEPNAGRGAVDFKFSSGYKSRVIVEVKLTTNNKLIHGYEKQLKEYQKAERNAYAIYLVIDNGGYKTRLESLINIYNKQQMLKNNNCELIIIDGNLKPSASKV